MAPVWSRTMPIPLLFSSLKIAPSKLILTKLASSGFHLTLGFGVVGRIGGSIAQNSANFSFACNVGWSEVQQGLRFRTWFCWCQISHVIIAKSSLFPWFLSIHDSSFLKFVIPEICWELQSVCDHTKLSSLQDHNACKAVSSSLQLLSHSKFSVMCLLFRLAFVGIALQQARHKKFLILFGTHKSQMLHQNSLSPTLGLSTSSYIFKNRYSDLHEYFPLCVHGQNNLSSIECLDKGIFLISSASSSTNNLSISFLFQVQLPSLINTSTFVSSQPSITGDWTQVGCLSGNQVYCQIWTVFPIPILQQAPRVFTSQPCKMLFQAYEPWLDSIIVQFGKNWGLKVL